MSENDNVAHALAGAGGGALAMVVTYPLVTLSTRAQTDSLRASAAKDAKSVSAVEAAKAIIKREGVAGLYSGLDSALFGITVTNFVYYYFYEGVRALYLKSNPRLSTAQSMLAGTIAGSATTVLTNPIWVVNTRMTVNKSQASTLETVAQIFKKDGIQAFFAGIGPALVLVINPVLQFTIFEQLRNAIEKSRSLTPLDAFVLGAIGKVIATSVTYPYITLKSRMQVSKGGSTSLIQGLKDIVAKEGVSGLYKGLNTKVLQSALTSAFVFFFKEQLFAVAIALLALIRRLR